MTQYILIDIDTLAARLAPLTEVAELMELHAEEIEWAIEEHGRCDTDRFIVLLKDPFRPTTSDTPAEEP